MRRVGFLILALALSLASSADTKVYQWTDENGVTHYSNQPPPEGTEAVERNVQEAPRMGSVPPASVRAGNTRESGPGNAPSDAAQAMAQVADPQLQDRLRQERCDRGRELVAAIEPADRIRVSRTDGTTEWLYGEERIAELNRARKMIRENCE